MSCPSPSLLQEFASGDLAALHRERTRRHLESCETCRVALREIQSARPKLPDPPDVSQILAYVATSLVVCFGFTFVWIASHGPTDHFRHLAHLVPTDGRATRGGDSFSGSASPEGRERAAGRSATRGGAAGASAGPLAGGSGESRGELQTRAGRMSDHRPFSPLGSPNLAELKAPLLRWVFEQGGRAKVLLDDGREVVLRNADLSAAGPGSVPWLPDPTYSPTAIHVSALEEMPPGEFTVQALAFEASPMPDGQAWNRLEEFRELESLSLCGRGMNGDWLAGLSGCRDLIELRLRETDFTGDTAIHLEQLQLLERLALVESRLDVTALRHLSRLPRLTELTLERVQLSWSDLEQLQTLPNLSTLGLVGMHLPADLVEQLPHLRRLRKLRLNQSAIEESVVFGLRQLKQLRQLDLSEVRVTADQLETLRKSLPDCHVKADLLALNAP